MKQVAACAWSEVAERSLHEPLGDAEMDALTAHMAECPMCRRMAEGAGAMDDLVAELRDAGEVRDGTLVDMAPPMTRLNELLGEYVVISELGRGGMGVVYKARQVRLNRMVALKVLPALLGVVRPDAMERFKREAALAASLKHSNIISVFDFGEVEGTLYYAMELVEGRTLQDLIKEMREAGGVQTALAVVGSATDPTKVLRAGGGVGSEASDDAIRSATSHKHPVHAYFRHAAQWIADVADALHFAHQRGVVHRDMKPSNLLLNGDGRLMISDFGLARSSSDPSLTLTRALMGTSRYMAPEMIDHALGPVGVGSDVYALGATLYELLTLQPLFAGTSDREILHHVQHREPAPPRAVVRQIPRELETVCLKALAKRPRDRYGSAEELANDLRRWRLDLPILARRPRLTARVFRFVRKHKVAVGATAIVTAALVTSAALAINYQRAKAQTASLETTAKSQRVTLMHADATRAWEAGRFDEALRIMEALLAENPQSADWRFLRAKCLRFMGRGSEAIAVMEQLIAENPSDWKTHLELATLYGSAPTEDAEKRRFHQQEFQRLKPDTPDAWWAQAMVEGDPRVALEYVNKALAANPNEFGYLKTRTDILRQLGQYDAMLLDAERLVAMRPGWDFTHVAHAQALSMLKRHTEAEASLTRAIELSPNEARYWAGRSQAREKSGRSQDALADALRAIELDPSLAIAHAAAGTARTALGDPRSALVDCDRAVALDPLNAELFFIRMFVHGQLGDWSGVVADTTRAIELLPNDPRGYRNRLVALQSLGQNDRALADASRYVELAPTSAEAHGYRAMLRERLGDDAGAVGDYTNAIKYDPMKVSNFYSRAECNLRLGRADLALGDLIRVNELQPGEPRVLLLRAMAYWIVDSADLAIADLDVLIARHPEMGPWAQAWKYLLLAQRGAQDGKVPALEAPDPNDGAWSSRVRAFLRHDITEDELLSRAAATEEHCTALFYIGARNVLDGHEQVARAALTQAADAACSNSIETVLARDWLRRMDSPH